MSEKSKTVKLSRVEHEALIERLEEAEDLATNAALGKEKARRLSADRAGSTPQSG